MVPVDHGRKFSQRCLSVSRQRERKGCSSDHQPIAAIVLGFVHGRVGALQKMGGDEILVGSHSAWRRSTPLNSIRGATMCPAMRALLAIVGLALSSCTAQAESNTDCSRRFSDDTIRQQVMDELKLVGDYEVHVNWSKCRYFLLILTPSRAPDSEIIVTLDEHGHIVDGPR